MREMAINRGKYNCGVCRELLPQQVPYKSHKILKEPSVAGVNQFQINFNNQVSTVSAGSTNSSTTSASLEFGIWNLGFGFPTFF